MKKMFFMLLLMLGIASSAFAQKGESQWNAGVTLGYGTDVSKGFVGVRAMYDIKPAFSLAAGFNYYFKRTLDTVPFEVEGKYWDVNLDFHWNVFRGDAYKLYPLIGLTYLHAKASVAGFSVSDGEVGLNLGFGGQWNFAEQWGVAAEAKYQAYSGGGQFVPSVSLMYRF